jgi:hypothetical protein
VVQYLGEGVRPGCVVTEDEFNEMATELTGRPKAVEKELRGGREARWPRAAVAVGVARLSSAAAPALPFFLLSGGCHCSSLLFFFPFSSPQLPSPSPPQQLIRLVAWSPER